MPFSRRDFLTYVRNKVAVGVLCSDLLTDALTTLEFVKQSPQAFTATQALQKYKMAFLVSEEVIEDGMYTRVISTGENIARQIREESMYE